MNLNAYSDFGLHAFPGIDVGVLLVDELKAFANVGYTYRVPTFTDLYYSDPINEGNEDLNAESALNYELGLKTRYVGGFRGRLSGFYRDGENIIDWLRASEMGKWRPYNVSELNFYGVQADAIFSPYEFAGKSLDFVRQLGLSYTYLESEGTEVPELFNSRYALEYLRHHFSGKLVIRYTKGLTHSFQLNYYDREKSGGLLPVGHKVEFITGTGLRCMPRQPIYWIRNTEKPIW